jgi:hypothetical protein
LQLEVAMRAKGGHSFSNKKKRNESLYAEAPFTSRSPS